jgi:hypothetical protein
MRAELTRSRRTLHDGRDPFEDSGPFAEFDPGDDAG